MNKPFPPLAVEFHDRVLSLLADLEMTPVPWGFEGNTWSPAYGEVHWKHGASQTHGRWLARAAEGATAYAAHTLWLERLTPQAAASVLGAVRALKKHPGGHGYAAPTDGAAAYLVGQTGGELYVTATEPFNPCWLYCDDDHDHNAGPSWTRGLAADWFSVGDVVVRVTNHRADSPVNLTLKASRRVLDAAVTAYARHLLSVTA